MSLEPISIELTPALAKILKLHGDPFIDASFDPGELRPGIAAGLEVPDHINQIVEHILGLQKIYNPLTYSGSQDQLEKIRSGYNFFILEAMKLSDSDFKIFDRHHAVMILSTLSQQIKSLPTFSQIMNSEKIGGLLTDFSNAIQAQLFICGFLQNFTHITKGRGEVGKIMGENFFHDALGHYCTLRDGPGYYGRRAAKLADEKVLTDLKFTLCEMRKFVEQVLDANLAIAKNHYEIIHFNPFVEPTVSCSKA